VFILWTPLLHCCFPPDLGIQAVPAPGISLCRALGLRPCLLPDRPLHTPVPRQPQPPHRMAMPGHKEEQTPSPRRGTQSWGCSCTRLRTGNKSQAKVAATISGCLVVTEQGGGSQSPGSASQAFSSFCSFSTGHLPCLSSDQCSQKRGWHLSRLQSRQGQGKSLFCCCTVLAELQCLPRVKLNPLYVLDDVRSSLPRTERGAGRDIPQTGSASFIEYQRTRSPPRRKFYCPIQQGGETQLHGQSPLKQSRRRTRIREAFPSLAPGLKYTDRIFTQMPDGGKRSGQAGGRLRPRRGGGQAAGTASAGVQHSNAKPPTHCQPLIPEQEPALQQEAERSCFTLEFFRQFLPPAKDSLPPLHPPPPAPHGRWRWGPELSAPWQRRFPRMQLRLQPANKLRESLEGRDLGLPLSRQGILLSCRLWSLLLWRYSSPAWTRCCAACCG